MESIIQAYSNKPRRKQLKFLGGFFLGLLILGVLLISYLIVSSRVVSAGRGLQNAKNEIDELEYENVSLQEEITSLTTLSQIKQQAKEQGYRPAQTGEVLFVVVPGYKSSLNPPRRDYKSSTELIVNVTKPEYHQTLLMWLHEQLFIYFDVFQGMES